MVYRGHNNANPNGGVSYANANNDASNANTNVGSRLADNRRYLQSAYDTRHVCPPSSRGECVVAIEINGEPKKFFTNSEEMKNILQQVSEMPDGFPFETTIKSETFGKGRTKYIFT